ncbi:hypothetical protein GCM10023063_05870 [Arthrobacter methylotrophus]
MLLCMTQDVYMGRKSVHTEVADVLVLAASLAEPIQESLALDQVLKTAAGQKRNASGLRKL